MAPGASQPPLAAGGPRSATEVPAWTHGMAAEDVCCRGSDREESERWEKGEVSRDVPLLSPLIQPLKDSSQPL